jgi:hypothetical protein
MKGLKEILTKLRAKEKKLKEKLESEREKEKQKLIAKQIKIIHAQRKKGIKSLRANDQQSD